MNRITVPGLLAGLLLASPAMAGHDLAEYDRHRAGYYRVAGERCTIQREYQSEHVLEGHDVTYK